MKRFSLRFLARRKFWQRTAFSLACLTSAIVAFYQIENFRGRATWEKYRREAVARGTKLDLRDFVLAPIPDEENFAAIPFMRQLTSRDKAVREAASKLGKLPSASSGFGNGREGQPVDLAAENNLRLRLERGLQDPRLGEAIDFDASRECFERSGQLAMRTDDAAADVLRAMEDFEPILAQFRNALPRPRNQLVTDDGHGENATIFYSGETVSISRRLHLHIAALLACDRTEEALTDWRVQYRLSEMFNGQPTLLASMLGVIQAQIAVDSVWQGISERKWTEEQLSTIEANLREVDSLAAYEHGIASDRAFQNSYLDQAKAGGAVLDTAFRWERLIPQGWFAQNQRRLNEYYDLAPPGAESSRSHRSGLFPSIGFRPYWFCVDIAIYGLSDNRRVAALAQENVDLCRIACALERFRFRRAAYPESLRELVPDFLPVLPPDRIAGKSFRYRRTEDGLLVSRHYNNPPDGNSERDVAWRVPPLPNTER